MTSVTDDAVALERAIHLALRAHWGQVYPSPDEEPFILHPLRVMLSVGETEAQIVAVLHDVVEDTEVTVEELRAEGLPEDLVAAVVALTRRDGMAYDEYIEQVAQDPIARKVKAADIADNLANNRRLPAAPEVAARIARYERALLRLNQ